MDRIRQMAGFASRGLNYGAGDRCSVHLKREESVSCAKANCQSIRLLFNLSYRS